MKEKVVIIINPISGNKKKNGIEASIHEILDHKFETVIEYTQAPGHATEIAKRLVEEGVNYVIAVGGDGTVNEIASALVHSPVYFGIIPAGSGNGLARHLEIPMKTEDAIRLLLTARKTSIDYGIVNDKVKFFCTTGVGFDAHIGYQFSVAAKRGFLTYIKTTIKEYFSYKPIKYRLKSEGFKTKHKAFLITVANASQYGNNAYIAPEANIQDGLLNVSVIKPFPKLGAVMMGLRLFGKSIDKSPYVETFLTNEIQVKRKKKGEIHFDGEPMKMGKKLNIKIVPAGLNVLVP